MRDPFLVLASGDILLDPSTRERSTQGDSSRRIILLDPSTRGGSDILAGGGISCYWFLTRKNLYCLTHFYIESLHVGPVLL